MDETPKVYIENEKDPMTVIESIPDKPAGKVRVTVNLFNPSKRKEEVID